MVNIKINEDNLIEYIYMDKKYLISDEDFKKVEEFCENECMGIKFLMNANFLRQLINALINAGFHPPFTNDNFRSTKYKDYLTKNGLMEIMQKQFGTDNVELVSKIVIKSTYNFLHKM